MRRGTARQGKSCIAWEEAASLQSPQQRLMQDASKTVERWVIPLQTLRAIVSTSFRSEPSIRLPKYRQDSHRFAFGIYWLASALLGHRNGAELSPTLAGP
jgi:hypothetical protein